MRRFEFIGGSSNKFWEISQSDTQVTVRFGRIGSDGQTQTKDSGSWDEAAERVRKLVAEKLREGYVEVGGSGPRPEAEPGFARPAAMPAYQVPSLPADGPLEMGAVRLPAGRRLRGDPQYAPRGTAPINEPVIWATEQPVPSAGRALYWLRSAAAAFNLTPILLQGMEGDPARPWDSGEFCPLDPRRVTSLDSNAELARGWTDALGDDEESLHALEPFGRGFPGRATPPPLGGRLVDDGDVLDQLDNRRVGLVAAARPADVVTAVGWLGAVNVHDDPAVISAVLGSWEAKWGARLVELGFDTMLLTVANPPREEKAALALAAEHFALCPDNVWQGEGTIAAYARELLGSRTWRFWWD